jgi:rhodanese-related sulfurtransferase
MPTYQELLDRARERVQEADPETARELLAGGATLIDVREQDEVDQGAIPGAVHIPRGYLEMRVENAVPDRDAPVVVYCAGGTRSLFGAETLQQLGYTNVHSLAGSTPGRPQGCRGLSHSR